MKKGANITQFKAGEQRLFKTDINYAQTDLNVSDGIIRDVAVCTAGEAKGHGVMLEQSFIEDVVRLGNGWKQGLKCRFGHPNMSNEAFGTYLGRFKNFRISGIKAIADLHLDELAKKAPGGDLYSYVLGMAEKNPDMFGSSISFQPLYEYFYDDNGQKVIGWNPADGPTFISIKDLFATDIVDEPAANNGGLFSSSQFNSEKFAVRVTEFLDHNPDIWKFVDANPDKFQPFLEKYASYRSKKSHISMSKKNKPKGFFSKIMAAFKDFATTDHNTVEGKNVRIVSANDDISVGDEVYIVEEDGSESIAPNGSYTISGGDLDGTVIGVVDGLISTITKPEVEETDDAEPVTTPAPDVIDAASKKEIAQLKADNALLKKQLAKLSADFAKFKKDPLAEHTTVGAVEDPITNTSAADDDSIFWNQPWNKKHKK